MRSLIIKHSGVPKRRTIFFRHRITEQKIFLNQSRYNGLAIAPFFHCERRIPDISPATAGRERKPRNGFRIFRIDEVRYPNVRMSIDKALALRRLGDHIFQSAPFSAVHDLRYRMMCAEEKRSGPFREICADPFQRSGRNNAATFIKLTGAPRLVERIEHYHIVIGKRRYGMNFSRNECTLSIFRPTIEKRRAMIVISHS